MSSHNPIVINARVTAFATGGQQRVAAEIMKRIPDAVQLMPDRPLNGIKGHLWEQIILPAKARGKLLWSPSATGPLMYPHQVVTVHDTAFFDVPEFFAPSFVRLYQNLIPRLARRVAKVVTVSEYSKRQLQIFTGLDASKIDVIYNGVAECFRPYSKAEIDNTRAAMKLPGRYLLVQATSDRRKNLARTLDAWRLVSAQLPDDLHLVVSGNLGRAHVFGESALNLEADRLHVTGYVADEHMGPLLAGAEALVFASLYEGFGLPLIEAMATGTPVITANNSALPEVAGKAALIVDASSTEEIAAAMVKIISNPGLASMLREAGYAQAKGFSWDRASQQYVELFERLNR